MSPETRARDAITSAAANPVTGSENVARTVKAELVGFETEVDSVTVGRVRSAVRTSSAAASLGLPAPSAAEAAATSTVTAPAATGVTVKLYEAPLPEKPETVPFPIVTSPAVKPVTSSENAAVTTNAPEIGSPAELASVTLGGVRSAFRVSRGAAVFGFPAGSDAAPAATSIVTAPSPLGVTVNVYVAPLPAKLEIVALPAVMSEAVNPVTLSENVAVTGNGPLKDPSAADSATDGRRESTVLMSCAAATFAFPAVSLAAPAATSTVTPPSAVGVTVNEYDAPEPESADAAPLLTPMSVRSKPVTISENVAVTVKAPFVGSAAVVASVSDGRVRSAVRASCVAGVLVLPAASDAAPAATSTVTVPSALGVTVNE